MDIDERATVTTLMESTCGCKKGIRSKPCSSQFSTDHVMSVRASCSELTRSELDMVVMGQMTAGMNDDTTTNSVSRHRAKVRQRVAITFHHQGKQICERMFRFLHTLGETRYKNLKKSLQSQGLSTRSHGNLKRSPAHALSLSSTEFVVRFLLNYAEQNTLLLPGRVPGYSRSDIKLLPSSVSKRGIWMVYQEAARSVNACRRVLHIHWTLAISPTTCHHHEANDRPLLAVSEGDHSGPAICQPLSKEEKSAAVLSAQEHLRIVKMERSFYTATCEECSRSVKAHFQNPTSFSPPPPASHIPPNSHPIKVHYSFDYAQQVGPINKKANAVIIYFAK